MNDAQRQKNVGKTHSPLELIGLKSPWLESPISTLDIRGSITKLKFQKLWYFFGSRETNLDCARSLKYKTCSWPQSKHLADELMPGQLANWLSHWHGEIQTKTSWLWGLRSNICATTTALAKGTWLTEVAPISDLIFDAEDDHRLLVLLLRVSQLLKSKTRLG